MPKKLIFTLCVSLFGLLFLNSCQTQSGASKAIPIADCHVHLYDVRRPNIHWPRKEHGILFAPHLPETYEKATAQSNVKAVVLALAGQNLEDNQWNLDIAAHKKGFYQGIVGNLSRAIGKDEFKPLFEKLCKDKRYVGYRLSGKYESAMNGVFFRDLKLPAAKGKTVDFLVGVWSLKEVNTVVKRIPALKIIMKQSLI
jgi:predicted TIM-barrel fold metal-dependent hydrolase